MPLADPRRPFAARRKRAARRSTLITARLSALLRAAPLSPAGLAVVVVLLLTGCGGGRSTPVPTVATGPAAAALAQLSTGQRASMAGYSRTAFGQAWTDDVVVDGGHNGCDTRNDILRRDLTNLRVKPGTGGCVALSGDLAEPYTGREVAFRRGPDSSPLVQIDHVVALGDAWQTGAQRLAPAERIQLANDPLELVAADGQANQDKGDSDAASWLPPNVVERCRYVARQVAIKSRYRLWVTPTERSAIMVVLAACPGQDLPDTGSTAVPAPRDGS